MSLITSVTDSVSGAIDNASKQADSIVGAAKNKASSLFENGGKEQLALIDKDTVNATSSLNKYKDQVSGVFSNILDRINNGSLKISSLAQTVDFRDGFKINGDQLASRLNHALGFSSNSVFGLAEQISRDSVRMIDQVEDGQYGQVFNTLGRKFGINTNINFSSANSIAQGLSRLSGADGPLGTLIDNPAQLSVLNSFLKQTTKIGLWQGIDILMNKYTVKDFGRSSLSKYSHIPIANGDVYTLNRIIEHAGAQSVIAKNNNAVPDILRNFTFKQDTAPSEYPAYLEQLLQSLNSLDPNWDTTMWGNDRIPNLGVFTNASSAAKKLLINDSRYSTQVMIASKYGKVDLVNNLKSKYPYMAVM